MADTIQKKFNNGGKNVKYINRDFAAFKDSLMQFTQTYYPNSYRDFTAASPGTMFMDQAAYIGDVLSYYTDYQFKESLLPYAEERKNIMSLASYLGYKSRSTTAATATIDVYQLIPAVKVENEYIPDETYALSIRENMQLVNSFGAYYVTVDSVDFTVNTKISPREDTIYSRDEYGIPQFFLLKKSVNVISGRITTTSFVVNSPEAYLNLYLQENNVIDVLSVYDSDNNRWYEVDYLAQDLIFVDEENISVNDGDLFSYNSTVPKLLKSIKTSRKFTRNITTDNLTYLQFGAGTDSTTDEIIYPTQDIVGVGLQNIKKLNLSYDSSKMLKSNSMGQAPYNTTLTVTYIVGGGIESNCAADDIKTVVSVTYANDESGMTPAQQGLMLTVKNSIRVTNPTPATGGNGAESVDEIRQNALANFSGQNRTVTAEDYITRVYSLPSKFGTVAKAFVSTNANLNVNVTRNISGFADYDNNVVLDAERQTNHYRGVNYDISNPFGINLYVLSYDSNKNLSKINAALLYNIRKYLEKYKMLTDSINIIDGYIINVGVDFKISVYNNYNKHEVLNNCIEKVKDFFVIDKWTFNTPININQLELEIAKTEGVQSVIGIDFKNLTVNDGLYSPHEYNLSEATLNNIIYPSLDPSVFEVKYPNSDIRGSCI